MGILEYRIQKDPNPKLSGIVFCGINRVIKFDFIEKSIILLQTVIVCRACINNAPITATHRAFFICVCMREAAHSHVLTGIFVFQPHHLYLKVL